jgi:CelD/BcsL family acetyltransferase involved in cellulose biosynthesis
MEHVTVISDLHRVKNSMPVNQLERVNSTIRFKCTSDIEDVREIWKQLHTSESTPFHSLAWFEAWHLRSDRRYKEEPVFVTGFARTGHAIFLLPLITQQRGPFKIITCAGNGYATYHSALISAEARDLFLSYDPIRILRDFLTVLPAADVLFIPGTPESTRGTPNPLLSLPHVQSHCTSSEMDLTSDWHDMYMRKRTAKNRSSSRRKLKRLKQFGDVEFHVPRTFRGRRALFNVLLTQKTDWLDASHLSNFLSDDGVVDFYQRLLLCRKRSEGSEPFLAALRVGDQPVAVTAGLIYKGCLYGLLNSMELGPMTRFSPGQLLLEKVLQHCCNLGLERVNFGQGEQEYKARWTDRTTRRYDIVAPLTASGQCIALAIRAGIALKQNLGPLSKIKHALNKLRPR